MNVRHIVLPLDRANVDTDQIIPAHTLTGVDSKGYGKFLLTGMTGGPELLAAHAAATVIVTRENFGCGSSREHAAWSLAERGFRAVIAPSFARIFNENAYTNAIAPIVVDAREIDGLLASSTLDIDLEHQTLASGDGPKIAFELDPLRKNFLLSGGYLAFLAAKIPGVRTWAANRAETAV